MVDKPKKTDLNIYLAKSGAVMPEDVIKDIEKLKCFKISVEGFDACRVYIKKTFSNLPRWTNFFTPSIDPDEFGFNSSTGALLYAKVDDGVFMLSFGQGFHLIDSAMIEMNFGLRTSLNLIDEESIRSIDKSSFEQHPTQSREQTGIATELQYFGLNIEQDLLRAITGKPQDERFGKRVSGMDALKLNVEVDLQKLPKLLKSIYTAYKDERYKKGPFAWVDHIGEVRDKQLHAALDSIILERINSGAYQNIWISVPDIIDWDRVVGFKYSTRKYAPRYYDIRIPDFIESLKEKKVDIDKLYKRKIYCVDSDDYVVYERPAYRFIYAEAVYKSDVYILNNGKWYKVSKTFADQVNLFFSGIDKYNKTLPIYNDETEGDYNERVEAEDPGSFVLLDKKNIRVTGAASPVEPCDLYRNGNEFIHVKRYGGSSVLSHLFNQGLVSGELFQMEPEFRQLLNSKLPDNYKLKDVINRPKTNEYHVVFAIISESDEDELSIPFFSRISLKHVLIRLQAIGFVVTVAKVHVDEIKKKTKKISGL
ncbi:MAG: TIGR04141 family sporadically distributed protein [Candidatus Thiodiazotropha sp. (ex Epidulcina cf. delphinae)]|nr:TIGR04141 family sporadically distributed protein [Candidatus Thiodiazotropha sp. (ex Epidulcina cf. delphinae)]